MSTKAIAYMRCSSRGQIDGDTWDRQQTAIARYAADNGIEVVAEYRDEGISGTKELDNRPGLAACLEHLENNGVKLVLVEDSSRLARDSMISEIIIREFQKAGGKVIAASGGVDLTAGDDSNPTAKLIRVILAAIADFDRCVTVLKLRAARRRIKAKNGRCEGPKIYGSTPEEETVLALMRIYRTQQLTGDEIATALNLRGLRSRSGKPWHGSTIRKIMARERKLPSLAPDANLNS